MNKVKSFLNKTWSYWVILLLCLRMASSYHWTVSIDTIVLQNKAFLEGFDAGETYGAEKGFTVGYKLGSVNNGALYKDVLEELEEIDSYHILREENVIQ